jgi:hypothetical protein
LFEMFFDMVNILRMRGAVPPVPHKHSWRDA